MRLGKLCPSVCLGGQTSAGSCPTSLSVPPCPTKAPRRNVIGTHSSCQQEGNPLEKQCGGRGAPSLFDQIGPSALFSLGREAEFPFLILKYFILGPDHVGSWHWYTSSQQLGEPALAHWIGFLPGFKGRNIF
jgi:hypothetical protein